MIKAAMVIKYYFERSCFRLTKSICCCLTESILVKNINFEVIHWFSDIHTYLFRITKISILKKSMGFQKYIPVSDYKNINFEEIHWFSDSGYKNINFEEINGLSEIYTSFGLQKYKF